MAKSDKLLNTPQAQLEKGAGGAGGMSVGGGAAKVKKARAPYGSKQPKPTIQGFKTMREQMKWEDEMISKVFNKKSVRKPVVDAARNSSMYDKARAAANKNRGR